MATKKQKEQLIKTLKFTPRDYKIEIGAYGGEIYFGAVDRKIYDFFKEHKIDIEEYAADWDEEKWEFVPQEMRPFEPGSPYDICGTHESGATFDDGNTITIYDEKGEEVWRCACTTEALEAQGVAVECVEETYATDEAEGTAVFYGAQGEKGLLFGNDFHLTAPFDPKKLTVKYGDYDGWEMIIGIEYDGEDIENYDNSTTGKWGEAKWIIVGDEEPYSLEDEEETSEEEDNDESWDGECVQCPWRGTVDEMADMDGELTCPECGGPVELRD